MPSPGRRLVVETPSLEHAREAFRYSPVPLRIEQLDRRAAYYWRSEEIALGPVTIATQRYGAAWRASAENVTDLYSVSMPDGAVGGAAQLGGVEQTIDRRQTAIHSPRGKTSFRMDTGYSGVQILVRGSAMRSALAALLGQSPTDELVFEPRLALDAGIGAGLERVVRFIVSESDHVDGLLSTSLAAARYGEAILASMLGGQANSYSRRLAKPDAPAGPRSVRLAADYLEANVTSAVRIADVAAVAGVSVRALQAAFLKHRGCTPLTFLRERRLDRAHVMLLAAGPEISVAAIARACGFAHIGRFSAHYRARFGESPLRTRRR